MYAKQQRASEDNNGVEAFEYEFGCDSPSRCKLIRSQHRVDGDFETEELALKHLNWKEVSEIAETVGAKPIPATGMTWGGFRFNAEGWALLSSMIDVRESAKRLTERSRSEARQQKREKVFRLAKETGEPQLLSSYMADCDDPEEQCSLDSVSILAMPDGTTKRKRQHTW
jgi:hypothetical protein